MTNSDIKIDSEYGADISIGLHINRKEKLSVIPYLLRSIIAFFGICGGIFTFTSSFPAMEFNKLPVFLISALMVLIVLLAAFFRKIGPAIIGVSYIIICVVGYIHLDKIIYGFLDIANKYLSAVRLKYYDIDYFDLSLCEYDILECRQIFLYVITAVLAITIGVAVIYHTSILLTFLAIFLPVELILYYGMVPQYIWFILAIACIVAVVTMCITEFAVLGKNRHLSAFHNASSQAGMIVFCVILALYFVVHIALNNSDYQRPTQLDDFKNSFSSYMRTFSWNKFKNDLASLDLFSDNELTASGAINHGKLGRNGDISFTDDTMLTVTTEKRKENLYLKGFTGVTYTGNAWKELDDSQIEKLEKIKSKFRVMYLSPCFLDGYIWYTYLDSQNLELLSEISTVSIINENANKDYLYLPYLITPYSSRDFDVNGDYPIADKDSYTVYTYSMSHDEIDEYVNQYIYSDDELSDELIYKDEATYRKYVYENYLQIPDTFTIGEAVYGDTPRYDVKTEIESIKKWLSDNCTYNLSAGTLPFGEDFVQYFLTENRNGSCSHFASAAVILCRYRGIPARYCEGYIIKPEDYSASASYGEMTTVNLKDDRAHAWIEVYIDGYGWYPYEVTPGYSDLNNESNIDFPQVQDEDYIPSEIETETQTEVQTEIVTEEQTEVTTTVKEKPVEDVSEMSETELVPQVDEEELVEDDLDYSDDNNPPSPWLLLLVIPLFALLLLVIRYSSINSSRKRMMYGKSAINKSLVSAKYLIKLCSFENIEKTDDISYADFAKVVGKESKNITEENAVFIISNGLQAKFSLNPPDMESAKKSVEMVVKYADKIYSQQNFIRKIYFKYICVL